MPQQSPSAPNGGQPAARPAEASNRHIIPAPACQPACAGHLSRRVLIAAHRGRLQAAEGRTEPYHLTKTSQKERFINSRHDASTAAALNGTGSHVVSHSNSEKSHSSRRAPPGPPIRPQIRMHDRV